MSWQGLELVMSERLARAGWIWQSAKVEIFMAVRVNRALIDFSDLFKTADGRLAQAHSARESELDALGARPPGGWFS